MSNYKEKYAHSLYKSTVTDNAFYFIRTSELPTTGFSSLYSVTAEDAEAMAKASSTSKFRGVVHSEYLTIDIDDSAMEPEKRLQDWGLAYELYTTGNRGYHIRIPRPHSPSHLLPLIDKQWVMNAFPEADISLYTPLHMFRLPGTRHEKTGYIKTLIEKQEGNPLILPETYNELNESVSGGKVGNSHPSIFLDNFAMALTVPHENGSRNNNLLTLGLYIKHKYNEPIEFIDRWLRHVNAMFEEPLEEREISNVIHFISGVPSEEL